MIERTEIREGEEIGIGFHGEEYPVVRIPCRVANSMDPEEKFVNIFVPGRFPSPRIAAYVPKQFVKVLEKDVDLNKNMANGTVAVCIYWQDENSLCVYLRGDMVNNGNRFAVPLDMLLTPAPPDVPPPPWKEKTANK